MTFVPDMPGAAPLSGSPPPAASPHPYLKPLFTGRKRVKYNLLALVWAIAAVWFWAWWLRPEHIIEGSRYWVVTAALGWLFFLQIFFIAVFRQAKVPAVDPPDPAKVRVAMIVTKTPSEPFSIVRRTLQAMLDQTYPHDTWLADEDPAPDTIAWCEAHGVKISTRKGQPDYHRTEWPRRTRCKEGNLAFFYDTYGYENYDFVAQLDADHVPRQSYLTEIMRGFADPRIGYVSAPSICSQNARESWAARTRLYTEAAFHGVFQTGYSGTMAPMCIGSHYAVRTKALREVGGLGPELAEDHSTTMLMNAGGWRGVHALDAIAEGDGPATITDLCTQEFQWSRSLVTLLLRYTPDYLPRLSPGLKLQFLFCQMLYPLFALFMLTLYLIPVVAVLFDIRYANVTYPAFFAHALAPALAITLIAYVIRADGFFRPTDGKVLSWEKALFLAIQWPWVLWGCIMALRDRLFGGFVDFRITPKGEAAEAQLPMRVILPYVALALGCLLPVLLVDDLIDARGFYLLTLLNGTIYAIIVGVVVIHHFKLAGLNVRQVGIRAVTQIAAPPVLAALVFFAATIRGVESSYALMVGLEPFQLVRTEYVVAGAGMGRPGTVHMVFDPGWSSGTPPNRED
ncbi:glycosyltransferase family 2 protein [Boseongicola sp. H5]|uniref:glycosyltransferase family 2 protein n=1 Tax=Rhodobacterales TaxID=204455 RepID=UPI001D0B9DC6|nr:glycosyltransferase family 2 protein [Boseongicola sp. H5]